MMNNRAEVLTVATHDERLFQKLIHNDFDINIHVLGFGQKWTGFKMKFILVYKYICTQPDDKIVVFLDGFDSTINGSLEEAISRFRLMKSKVLFSKNPNNNLYGLEKIVFQASKTDGTIINTGMYMGYVKYLKILLKKLCQQSCNDDQVIINKIREDFDFISVDKNCNVFKNIYNTDSLETEMKYHDAVFFSQPGMLSYSRIVRSIFEYGQFFLQYLFFLYAVIGFCLYKSKKYKPIIVLSILFICYLIKIDKSCL